jgi:hypothetical protein
MHTIHLVTHKPAGTPSCVCAPDILHIFCPYFMSQWPLCAIQCKVGSYVVYRAFTMHTFHQERHTTAGTLSCIYALDICTCFICISEPNGRFAPYIARRDPMWSTDHLQCIHFAWQDMQQQTLQPVCVHLIYAFVSLLLYSPSIFCIICHNA